MRKIIKNILALVNAALLLTIVATSSPMVQVTVAIMTLMGIGFYLATL